MLRTNPARRIGLVLWIGVLVGCGAPETGSPEPAVAAPVTEVWLEASCDVEQRLGEERRRLQEAGVVEVHGGQPLRWSFACEGTTLRMQVEALGPPVEGAAVLWLGAATDPARLVPVYLDAGRGAEALADAVRACEAAVGAPIHVNLDLATGVAWRPGGAG